MKRRGRAGECAREAARVRVRAQGRAHASEVKREDEFLHTDTNVTASSKKEREQVLMAREERDGEKEGSFCFVVQASFPYPISVL